MSSPTTSSHIFHFISGSFRSLSLFLLAFDPARQTIHHVQTISTLGPHQYLATNQHKDRIFTTSWAQPPSLQSWVLQRSASEAWRISYLNTAPITATSSYVNIPPPFTHIYSVGGPTGEVHLVDKSTGSFGQKTQEILFVPEAELPQADKTRVALRYGSHGVESTSTPEYSLTFVPVLGTDSIEVYSRNVVSGELSHISSSPSPRGSKAHDGPRHVKVHPNGRILYCVTEHSNFVDLYEITAPNNVTPLPTLRYISSRSLLPSHLTSGDLKQFRGDTLMLAPPTHARPSPYVLFTTTRGSTPATRGWLSIFALDEEGYFADKGQKDEKGRPLEVEIRYETASSGGKANAIDLLTKRKIPLANRLFDEDAIAEDDDEDEDEDDNDNDFGTLPHKQAHFSLGANRTKNDSEEWQEEDEGVWILLTDDDETTAAGSNLTSSVGGVKILEWGGWGKQGVHVIAEWPERPPVEDMDIGVGEGEGMERMRGGSHAIWLV